jgi:hypothetical protein
MFLDCSFNKAGKEGENVWDRERSALYIDILNNLGTKSRGNKYCAILRLSSRSAILQLLVHIYVHHSIYNYLFYEEL